MYNFTVPCFPSSHPQDVSAILGSYYPTLLCIVFSSYGIFLHISASAVDSRISTYIVHKYFNLVHNLYIFEVFCLRVIRNESKHVRVLKF